VVVVLVAVVVTTVSVAIVGFVQIFDWAVRLLSHNSCGACCIDFELLSGGDEFGQFMSLFTLIYYSNIH
jgi:hypothetical protein